MAYFADSWYGDAENIYYNGWLIDGLGVEQEADDYVYVADFDFSLSSDGFDLKSDDFGVESSLISQAFNDWLYIANYDLEVNFMFFDFELSVVNFDFIIVIEDFNFEAK